MNKNEYLVELNSRLRSLPPEERESALKYYDEFFADAGTENEQDVIAKLGNPKSLAENIIKEQEAGGVPTSEYMLQRQDEKASGTNSNNRNNRNNNVEINRGNNNILAVVLILVLTFPIWFSVVVAVFATAFALWVSLGVISLALILGGLVSTILGVIFLFISPVEGGIGIGVGLIVFAVGLFFLAPFLLVTTRLIPAIFRGVVDVASRMFHGKKTTA